MTKDLLLKLTALALLLTFNAEATDYTAHANAQFASLMETTGTCVDATSNGNDLTETGGTIPRSSDRQFGDWSRDFEAGDTESFNHADGLSTDISGADQKLTLVAWIKVEAISNFQGIIVKWSSAGGNKQYTMDLSNGTTKLEGAISSDGTTTTVEVGGTTINTGTWYHVAFVYNDVDLEVFVDGSSDSTPLAFTSGISNGSQIFELGAYSNTLNFDGLMDEPAVFDTDLSSTQINDIMDNGLQGAEAATFTPKMMSF